MTTDVHFHVDLEVEAPFLAFAVTWHIPHVTGCDVFQGTGNVPEPLPVRAGFVGARVAAFLCNCTLLPWSSAHSRTSWYLLIKKSKFSPVGGYWLLLSRKEEDLSPLSLQLDYILAFPFMSTTLCI